MSNAWFRFYSEAMNDPKVDGLPPHLFKTWVKLLCLACRSEGGKLPPQNDVAYFLRMSVQDCAQHVDDLILAGLIDVNPDGSRVPHNWSKRQYASDSSTIRSQKHRQIKRNGDATLQQRPRNGDATPPDPDSDTDSHTVTNPRAAARADDAGTGGKQVFKLDLNGGGGARRTGARQMGRIERQAEGFGLDVAGILKIVARNQPKNPGGYFVGLCVKRLQPMVPGASENLLRAALRGDAEAAKVVFAAMAEVRP